jgi:hypothetical protein
MDLQECKHWFYKLKREEKDIVKALIQVKKLEQKRKLKKLSKQWKIDSDHNIEIDYLKNEREAEGDKDIKIPEHFKNISEYLFFGDDTEFLRHYKRTCRNVLDELNRIFLHNKQTIKRGVARNVDIIFTEVKMNKACTVVYAWWDAPFIPESKMLNPEQLDEIYNKIQLNLNQSEPYIKGVLTRAIGLKYTPAIKFIKDNFNFEIEEYENYLDKVKQNNQIAINNDKANPTNKIDKDNVKNQLLDLLKSNNIDIDKLGSGEDLDEQSENLTKGQMKVQKRFKKYLKKNNVTPDDLKPKKIDYNSAYFNFLNNYDRPIPGSYRGNVSFKEMEEYKKRHEKIDEDIRKTLEEKKKKDVRDSRRLVEKAPKIKKNKTEEFWKNIDRL